VRAGLRRVAAGIRALIAGRRLDEGLDEELGAYLHASIDDGVRRGLSVDEATSEARSRLGSVQAVKAHTRAAGWEATVDAFWRDLRLAGRGLRRSPGFSLVAIVVLALGIGATTVVFSAVNAILLRRLPVDRPHELLGLRIDRPDGDSMFSYEAYRDIAADGAAVVDPVASSTVRREAISLDARPEPVDLAWVSANYFTTLGVGPATGRTLVADDGGPGRRVPVAVLSDAFWTRRFGRDPAVVGRTFRLKTALVTIVGVARRGYSGESPGEGADLWMPLEAQPGAPEWLWTGHSTTWLRVLARQRAGVTDAQARSGLEAAYARLRTDMATEADSPAGRASALASRLVVTSGARGASRLRDNLSAPLLVAMILVVLVLLVACANLANLMVARAAVMRRDTALRLAIGAGRVAIVRERLAEALLLAAVGGASGMALAVWGTRALAALLSTAFPIALDISPDRQVFAFALAVSLFTALVCGAVPALRASRVDPLPALKDGGRGGRQRLWLGRTLVVAQVAISMVLLVAAALFVRSLVALGQIDTGFDPDRVLLFSVAPPVSDPPLPIEERRQIFSDLVERAAATPGVAAVSASFSGVFGRGTWGSAIAIDGVADDGSPAARTLANAVTPRYFEVMRIALLRGRDFTTADRADGPKVAVVSDAFVRRYLSGTPAVGRRIGFCTADPCGTVPADRMMEVIGVAEDAKYVDVREEPRAMVYVPASQSTQNLREFQVRTAGAAPQVADALARVLQTADARVSLVRVVDARTQVDASLVAERALAALAAVFGGLALGLACVGLYGLVAYTTSQRTGEIGIRMALGARGREIVRLVLRDTLNYLAIGGAVGTCVALLAARAVQQQLYGIGPADPVALLVAVGTLVAAALVAGCLPARRASRVDPVLALRAD
jgi:putative ABC transport system permease protein